MIKNELVLITDGKEKIKCSNCGSEKKFVLMPSLDETKVKFESFSSKAQMTEQQKYIAHIFEAQRRFGE